MTRLLIFLHIIIIILGCASTKTNSHSVNKKELPINFDFYKWQSSYIDSIEKEFGVLDSDSQLNYNSFYYNLTQRIRSMQEDKYLSLLDTAFQYLGKLPQEYSFYFAEYYNEGETSELSRGFFLIGNQHCKGIRYSKFGKWESIEENCNSITELMELNTVWEEEPKSLNGYLLISKIEKNTMSLGFVIAPSAWQFNLAEKLL